MRGFIAGLGLFGAIAACSSFSADDAAGGGGADAGADGRSDVTGIPHAFDLSLAVEAAVVTGSSVSIPVTITRGGAATGPSTLEVQDLGDGLKADLVTIQESETTANLVIVADAGAKQGLRKLKVVGRNAAANDSVPKALDLLVRGPSGTLDQTWGSQGVAALPDGLRVVAMTPTTSGALTVAGVSDVNGTRQRIVTRLTSTGSVDPGFNTGAPLVAPGEVALVDGALLADALGAGWFSYPAAGKLVRFHFDGTGKPDVSKATNGLQTIDGNVGAEAVAVDPQGNLYSRNDSALRRYKPDGVQDFDFAPPALQDNFPYALVAGGNRLLLVLSSSVGQKLWRVDGSNVTSLAGPPLAATIDPKNNFYVAKTGYVITRYRTGFGDVDTTFKSPPTSDTSSLVGLTMTAFEDELFVYGGTGENIGGPVASDTILRKYSLTGAAVTGFGKAGVADSFSGRFVDVRIAKTGDNRIYVARKITDNSGQRSILRYWN